MTTAAHAHGSVGRPDVRAVDLRQPRRAYSGPKYLSTTASMKCPKGGPIFL
jgi:hypothetical protein